MKKISTLLASVLFISSVVSAQTYSFESITGTYSDLSNPVSLNNGLTWDDPTFLIPIGFDWTYFGNQYDTIFISNAGYGATFSMEHTGPDLFPVLIAFGADLVDRASDTINFDGEQGSLSPVSYQLEGPPANQVLKIEWKNAGFYPELADDNIASDSINLQLWLFQANNNIEIHFGPVSVANPSLNYEGETGAYILLSPHVDLNTYTPDPNSISLSGGPVTPDTTISSDVSYLGGTVPEGTIYRFIYETSSSINEAGVNEPAVILFPNPAQNTLSVFMDAKELAAADYSIVNALGETVKTTAALKSIDVSGLADGVYFLRIPTKKGIVTKRFVKN